MKIKKISKSRMKSLFNDYNHLLFLLYYLVISYLQAYVNSHILVEDIEVLMNYPLIDEFIPFCKYMVIPYIMWYPYIVIPLVYFALKDKEAYFQLCIFMFGGMTICYIIFFLVPNGIGPDFRPILVDNDIVSRILNTIYIEDNPTNSCPSMHVLDSVAVHLAIKNSDVLKNNKPVQVISLILAISISVSTVFVKQHSIIDVVVALFICTILYRAIYSKHQIKWFNNKKHKHGFYFGLFQTIP